MEIFYCASSDVSPSIKNEYKKTLKIIKDAGHTPVQTVLSPVLNEMTDSPDVFGEIYNEIMRWINAADLFIADISNPSGGVGYQVFYAIHRKKPVIIIYNDNKLSNPSVIIRGIKSKKVFYLKYKNITDIEKNLPQLIKKAGRLLKIRFHLVISNDDYLFIEGEAKRLKINRTAYLKKLIKSAKEHTNSLPA